MLNDNGPPQKNDIIACLDITLAFYRGVAMKNLLGGYNVEVCRQKGVSQGVVVVRAWLGS